MKDNKKNIILIVVDAMRADCLSVLGIDELLKDSTIFENAFATGPMTLHSFPGILTSTYLLDYHTKSRIYHSTFYG